MAKLENITVTLIDSAIGPVSIQESTTDSNNYDIDDYVHDMLRSQAITLQLYNKASGVDDTLAKDRFPVTIGGVVVGGLG